MFKYDNLNILLEELRNLQSLENKISWWKPIKPNSIPNEDLVEAHYVEPNTSGLRCVDYSKDHNLFAIGCQSGALYLYDTTRQKKTNALHGHSKSLTTCSFSSDGLFLVSGDAKGHIYLFCLVEEEPKQLRSFDYHSKAVWKVMFLEKENERKFLSCSNDNTIYIVTIKELEFNEYEYIVLKLLTTNSGIGTFTLTKNNFLFVGCDDCKIYKFELEEYYDTKLNKDVYSVHEILDKTYTRHKYYLKSVVLSKSENLIASCGAGKDIFIWDPKTSKTIKEIKNIGEPTSFCVLFSTNEKYIFVSSNNLIRQFDIESGELFRQFTFHGSKISQIMLLKRSVEVNEDILVSICDDEMLRLINPTLQDGSLEYPRPILTNGPLNVPKIKVLATTKSNTFLVLGHEKGIISVYNTKSGELLHRQQATTLKTIKSIAISEDEVWICALTTSKTDKKRDRLHLWQLTTGESYLTQSCDSFVLSYTFSKIHNLLIYFVSDEGFKFFSLKEEKLIASFPETDDYLSIVSHPTEHFYIAVGRLKKAIRLEFDEELEKVRQTDDEISLPFGIIKDSAFSPNGKFFACCSKHDIQLRYYNGKQFEEDKKPRIENSVHKFTNISFTADSQFLFAFFNKSCIAAWSSASGVCIKSFNTSPSIYHLLLSSKSFQSQSLPGIPLQIIRDGKGSVSLPNNESTIGFSIGVPLRYTKGYLLGNSNNRASRIVLYESNQVYFFHLNRFIK